MQTFLPYADFHESAASLDRQRLGKQRVENLQILKAMLIPGYGWANHPAVKMWEPYKNSFLMYHGAIIQEWTEVRGYKDTCWEKFVDILIEHYRENEADAWDFTTPPWLGDEAFHRGHQSNLIRKDPLHYGPQFPGVPDNLDYIWPVQ